MKVLIIGKNSYIGENVKKYLNAFGHDVCEFDVEHSDLCENLFEEVDSVIHVAAIVHRKDIKEYETYKRINVELPFKVAQLAKAKGVKQFVFLSSMAVYGADKSLKGVWLNENFKCQPESFYGKSKYEAETLLNTLEDNDFKVAHIRPANVYGKDCRGSYMRVFKKIVEKLPFIPVAFENVKQGMLYIENLCELIKLIVEKCARGIFPAQDKNPVSSVEMMTEISKALNIKRKKSKIVTWAFNIFRVSAVKKLYGGVAYDQAYSTTELGDYCKYTFSQGIYKTFCVETEKKEI